MFQAVMAEIKKQHAKTISIKEDIYVQPSS